MKRAMEIRVISVLGLVALMAAGALPAAEVIAADGQAQASDDIGARRCVGSP